MELLIIVVVVGALITYPIFFVLSYLYTFLVSKDIFNSYMAIPIYFWLALNLISFLIMSLLLPEPVLPRDSDAPFQYVPITTVPRADFYLGPFLSFLLLPSLWSVLVNFKLLKDWSYHKITALEYAKETAPLYILVFALISPISALFLYDSRFIVGYLLYPYKFLIEFSS